MPLLLNRAALLFAATILAMAVTGCAPVKMKPTIAGETLYITKIDGASAQLVLPEELQSQRLIYKPPAGSWKSIDVEIGGPAVESLISHISSIVQSPRIGNVDDGLPATVTITPEVRDFYFSSDDQKAVNTIALVGVLGMGSKVNLSSSVTIGADLVFNGGRSVKIEATGSAEQSMGIMKASNYKAESIMGAAIDDAAKKLSTIIAQEIRNESASDQKAAATNHAYSVSAPPPEI